MLSWRERQRIRDEQQLRRSFDVLAKAPVNQPARRVQPEMLTALATTAAAIAAGLSVWAAFRLEAVTLDATLRHERAAFSSNLYGKEVDIAATFVLTGDALDDRIGEARRGITAAAKDRSALPVVIENSLPTVIAVERQLIATVDAIILLFSPQVSDKFNRVTKQYNSISSLILSQVVIIKEQKADATEALSTVDRKIETIQLDIRKGMQNITVCLSKQLQTGSSVDGKQFDNCIKQLPKPIAAAG
jgi:hypothetical protein